MTERKRTGDGSRPTLHDVAALAQVSVSTVSHVLNNTAKISDATRERVMQAVHTLHYQAGSESANRVFRGDKRIVGVIVQDIKNEFYAACAASVLCCADAAKYTVILCDCRHDVQREESFIHELIYQRASGLIIFGGANDDALISLADRRGISVVLVNRHDELYNSIMFANAKAVRELVHRLYAAGRRKFLYLSESRGQQSILDRKDGFCLGMIDNRVSPQDYHIVMDKRLQMNKVATAGVVLEEYIQENGVNFDTIVTCSDLIALGAMKRLAAHGLRVPDDIWLVGYDDISVASLSSPPLTTIHLDIDRLGEESVRLLDEMIQSQNSRPKLVVIENTIVARGSAPL